MDDRDLDQGTAAWKDARVGFVTASRICDVLSKPRKSGSKESAVRANYRAQLICERLTGKSQEREFQTWDTRRGIELEPFARVEYEMKKGLMVNTVGFVKHATIKMAGCSPDGEVGEDGLVQIKSPKNAIHLDYLLTGIVPVEYRPQMQFEMSCTGRKWSDFVSYNQNLPEHLQLFVVRLKRNDAEIAIIEEEVLKFNAEIEEIMGKLPKGQPDDLTEEWSAALADLKERAVSGDAS